MNPQCKAEIKNCTSLAEILAVIEKYYDLNKPLGMVTANYVKAKVVENFTSIIQKLDIKEKQNFNKQNGTSSRNSFF